MKLKALKVMEERELLIAEAQEVLTILGATTEPVRVITDNSRVIELEEILCNKDKEIAKLKTQIANLMNIIEDAKIDEHKRPEVIKPEEFISTTDFTFNKTESEYINKGKGSFTYNNKTYYFAASDNMLSPMVYGAKSQDVIDACKLAISKNVSESFYDFSIGYDEDANNPLRYHIDLEREVMIYHAPDGSFKGYFQGKAFVWDCNYDIPCYANYKNAINNKYRAFTNEGQAALIMVMCQELASKMAPVVSAPEVVVIKDDIETNPWDFTEEEVDEENAGF
jgi:hypothetical protein